MSIVRQVAMDAGPPVDVAALKQALGAFATGVTVVTTLDPCGAPVGFTANSFTSVSLDPPLVLACLARGASSHAAFSAAPGFAVNVLTSAQEPVARAFATRGADKFAAAPWRARETGAPVLDGALAWFDCHTHQRVGAGDHDILIGAVAAFGRGTGAPLAYWSGRFAALAES